MNRKTIKTSQTGIAHLALLVAFILLAVGGTGYYVFNRQQSAPETAQQPPKNENSAADSASQVDCSGSLYGNTPCPSEAKIPENWTVYDSAAYGFSFAFPKEWGKLTDAKSSFEPETLAYLETAEAAAYAPFKSMGHLSVAIFDKAQFKVQHTKYGAFIKLSKPGGLEWEVVSNETEPNVDDELYKPGDPYPVSVSRRTSNATKIFYHDGRDERCETVNKYSFETPKAMVTLQTPSVCWDFGQRSTDGAGGANDIHTSIKTDSLIVESIDVQ